MRDYLHNSSPIAEKRANFRQQMADFARGERLRELREQRHLSQEDAAHEIGVSVRSLRAWEQGGKIRWENAKRAGGFYRIDPESLVTREENGAETIAVDLEESQLDRIEHKLDRILKFWEEELSEAGDAAAEPVVPPRREPASRKTA